MFADVLDFEVTALKPKQQPTRLRPTLLLSLLFNLCEVHATLALQVNPLEGPCFPHLYNLNLGHPCVLCTHAIRRIGPPEEEKRKLRAPSGPLSVVRSDEGRGGLVTDGLEREDRLRCAAVGAEEALKATVR